jgi:beta-lactamase regulating signal transducer with metallopeptidase domain
VNALVPLLAGSSLRISAILLVALLATALLRKRSAALRHRVLATALLCAALLPVLERIAPAWHIRPVTRAAGVLATTTRLDTASLERPVPPAGPAGRVGPAEAWLAGALFSLSVLGIGLARMTWISRRSEPLACGRWRALADETARAYGITRPVLLLRSPHPSLLVTWGLLRPEVLLPATASGWSEERMRIVLAHELAHVRRGDWAFQMGAELLRALYWFNPLAWIACTRLRRESERACDDAVLARGVEATEYATELMHLARGFSVSGRTWLLSVAPESPVRPTSKGGSEPCWIHVSTARRRRCRPASRSPSHWRA